MEDNRQIKIGAVLAYGTIAFNILAGLIYTPWMIREIGQSDYGIYGLATSLIGMFTMDFGLGNAAIRFISKYRAENDEKKINQFMGLTFKLYLIIDAVIFLVLVICFIFMSEIYQGLDHNEIIRLRVVFVIAGLFSTISFPFQTLNGLISSYEKFIFQKIMEFVNKAGTIAIMIILLMNGKGLYALVLVNAFVGIVVIAIKLWYLKRNVPIKIEWTYWNKSMLKEIFGFSIWIAIIVIAQNLIYNIMPTILGITSNTVEISKFTAASTIEGYVYTFSYVISGMFMPQMARMIHKNKNDEVANAKEITELMIKIGRIQMVIVGAIIAIFTVFGKDFVELWLGKKFGGTYETILLMIIPTAIIAIQGIAETYVSATGKIKYNAYGTIVAAIVAVVIAFVLSSTYGAIGAGIGVCIGNTVGRVAVMNIFYIKKFGLYIGLFFKECFMKLSVPIILTIIIAYVLEGFIKPNGWIIFFIKAMISGVIYCILIWIVGLNLEEKENLKRSIGAYKKKM